MTNTSILVAGAIGMAIGCVVVLATYAIAAWLITRRERP